VIVPIQRLARALVQMHLKGLAREYKKNEQTSAPDNQQIVWHIRNIREDISLLCKIKTKSP
jgi:hypothetical protein